jgi:hypothetical protein
MHGLLGKFFKPSIFQLTPQITFKAFKINKIHNEANFCNIDVLKNGKRIIIKIDTGITDE